MKLSPRQIRLALIGIILAISIAYSVILGLEYFTYPLLAGLLFVLLPIHNWLAARNAGAKFLSSLTWSHLVITLPAAAVVGTVSFINAFIARGCTEGFRMEMGSLNCLPVEASQKANPAFIGGGVLDTLAFWLLIVSLVLLIFVTPLVALRQLRSGVEKRIKT